MLLVFLPACLTVTPARAEGNTKILQTAQNCAGKTMWSGYGLSSGRLGCAAALSNVLNQAGYKQARSAGVRVLYQQLRTTRGAKDFVLPGDGKTNTASAFQNCPPALVFFDFQPSNPENHGLISMHLPFMR